MSVWQKKSLLTLERSEKIIFLFPSLGHLLKLWTVLDFLVYIWQTLSPHLLHPQEGIFWDVSRVLVLMSPSVWQAVQCGLETLLLRVAKCDTELLQPHNIYTLAAKEKPETRFFLPKMLPKHQNHTPPVSLTVSFHRQSGCWTADTPICTSHYYVLVYCMLCMHVWTHYVHHLL